MQNKFGDIFLKIEDFVGGWGLETLLCVCLCRG